MSDDLTKAAPAVVQQRFVLPCAACGAGPAPDPASHCWQCGEELKSNQENNPMKLKELITQLLSCDMNADVQIHAANGTAMLPAMRISDCKERPEGDTTEPRVCIMCYDQEPATVETLA